MANENPSLQSRVLAPAMIGNTQLIERAVMLLLVAGLLLGVLAVLRPFTTAILFGAILAIAAWALRDLLLRRGLKRGLTATLLLLLALTVVGLPLLAVAPGLAEHLAEGGRRVQAYIASAPQVPAGLAGLPIVGERLTGAWNQTMLAEGGIRAVLEPTPPRCGRHSSAWPGRSPKASCKSSYHWLWQRCSGSAATHWRQRCGTSSGGLVARPP